MADLAMPKVTRDYTFFFEGLANGELLVQQCDECATLRHPPAPMCRECRSFSFTTPALSGWGTLYSYIVHHKPQLADYPQPHVVALVDMAEGVRVIGALIGCEPDAVRIDMPVEVEFAPVNGVMLHRFRPAEGAAR